MKVEDLEKKMEGQEQSSRRYCILIHGLKEEKNESTDDRVLKLFREELNEDVLMLEIICKILLILFLFCNLLFLFRHSKLLFRKMLLSKKKKKKKNSVNDY